VLPVAGGWRYSQALELSYGLRLALSHCLRQRVSALAAHSSVHQVNAKHRNRYHVLDARWSLFRFYSLGYQLSYNHMAVERRYRLAAILPGSPVIGM
jgi:hypothetical protein